MITHTGVEMSPGCGRSPTAKDIAVGLCRITRYAGAIWCPLAAHSILVAEYAFLRSRTDFLWACGLLHDAHETVTGEITRHYKPREMKPLEHELDEHIFGWFDLSYSIYRQHESFIKEMDEMALCAEATLLSLKNWPDYYRRMEGHDIPKLSDIEMAIAKLVIGGWSASVMIEENSPQQCLLKEVLEDVQEGRIDEARKLVSVMEMLKL